MDDAILGLDVGTGHGGAANGDLAIFNNDRSEATGKGLHFFAVQAHGGGGWNSALDHVVLEDFDQLVFVFGLGEVSQSCGWNLCKGFVGGSEDGERTRALEGFNQAGLAEQVCKLKARFVIKDGSEADD